MSVHRMGRWGSGGPIGEAIQVTDDLRYRVGHGRRTPDVGMVAVRGELSGDCFNQYMACSLEGGRLVPQFEFSAYGFGGHSLGVLDRKSYHRIMAGISVDAPAPDPPKRQPR